MLHKLYHVSFSVFFALCFLTQTAWAEDITITVLQKGTGDPVDGATVVLKKSGLYEITDTSGKVTFFITPTDGTTPDEVKVLNPGYNTLVQDVPINAEELTLYLRPNLAEIEGLEVVEERTEEKISKVVLSTQELRQAPGSQGDPIKVLQSLPGVVSTNGSGAGQVYMRGSDNQENIYWVNQLPVNYLYHWGGAQSVINPSLVSDFNVFLGGFPVEYGDFLGGAIDVKLRAPKKDRIHTNLHLGTYESSFLIEGPLSEEPDSDSFYLAARRSYLDVLFTPERLTNMFGADSENVVVMVPKFYDSQGLYRHETDAGYLDFQYFSARDQVEFILNDTKVVDPELTGDLKVDSRSETIGLNWEQQWSDELSQHVTAGVVNSSQYFKIGSDPYGEPYFSDIKGQQFFIHPSLKWNNDANSTTTLGLDTRQVNFPIELYASAPSDKPDPGGFTGQTKYKVSREIKATSYAPYLKHQYQWNEQWKTSVGLRYTGVSIDQGGNSSIVTEQGTSPRLSAEYQLNENTLLLASWGDYYQLPQGFQMLADFGNPNLTLTRAEHRILGMEHTFDDIWSIKVEAYHKPMTDLVITVDGAGPPDNFTNQGEGVAYGADIFLKRTYENRKLGWLSYSYARSKRTDLNTGITSVFAGDQPHTLTLVWGQPFTDAKGNDSQWDWGIKFQTHSGQPYTPVVGRTQEAGTGRWLPVYAEYNSGRLPTYAKLDIRFSKDVLYDTWKIKYVFDVQNATFQQNISSYDYEDDWSNYNDPTPVSNNFFMPFIGIEAEF